MTRYLSVGTYPRLPATQGGRLRLDAMHQILRANGWQTRHVWIGMPDSAGLDVSDDVGIIYSRAYQRQLRADSRRPDIAVSEWLQSDIGAWAQFMASILEFDPDVVSVEQAMAWPAVRQLLTQAGLRHSIGLVYSAHNVEQQLFAAEAGLREGQLQSKDLEELIRIENSLTAEADLVIAVSEIDAAFFRRMNVSIHVARNGIWPHPVRPGRAGGLFVGSAHPPNAAGFAELCGPWLKRARPGQKLTVAGGVCNLLQRQFGSAVEAGHLKLLGVLDQVALHRAIDSASFLLLPIMHGGGTNIKTAEALASGKPIAATNMAMRGFEAFGAFPGVHLAQSPEEYAAILDILDDRANSPSRNAEQLELVKALAWTNTMRELPQWLLGGNRFGWKPPSPLAPSWGRNWFQAQDGWLCDSDGLPRQIAPTARCVLPRSGQRMRVKLRLSAMGDAPAEQEVTVMLDGAELAELRFSRFGQCEAVILDIPEGGTGVELQIHCQPLLSYLEIGIAGDHRHYGVRIETMTHLPI